MSYPIISADSHVIERDDSYTDYIDRAWRDRAPRLIDDENGVWSVIDGMPRFKIGGNFGPGLEPRERAKIKRLDQLNPSGWDPALRAADQDRDGVSAEIIYPSVGMILCNHKDLAYKAACFAAYNRWLGEYCSYAPERLLGVGQTAMRTPEEGIADLHAIKALGLRGVMLPGEPGVEDYDSPIYDPFWQTAIELNLPLSFHIVAVGGNPGDTKIRGPKLNGALAVLRGIQDLLGAMVLGGVFERNPKLKIVCVEGDAGWLPHYLHRIDRAYREHGHKFEALSLSKMPSEYFLEHIYLTFQDDLPAWRFAGAMNWHRLMWANDFPHSDATWPYSQKLLETHTAYATPEQKRAILCDNVAGLYGIKLDGLTPRVN